MLRFPVLVTSLVTMLAAALPAAQAVTPRAPFDLQAHRGGMGLSVESSLLSFGTALDLGVRTLELDVQITRDGRAVVTHDRRTNPQVCRDTAPVRAGDRAYPYVGKLVKDLTLAQIETLDCGSLRRPDMPAQRLSPGARMLQLHQVFDLARARRADGVRFNVETKVEAGSPQETAPREQFVQVVAAQVRRAGVADRTSIESFDWGALMRMRQVAPELPTVALMNEEFLQLGKPGASPWLGGLDADAYGRDPATALVGAAHSFGASAISPVQGTPQSGGVTQPGFVPFTTPDMIEKAHAVGMAVIPWTVDDVPTMQAMIDAGADGLITDYPDRLRWLLVRDGLPLPDPHPAR